MLACENCVIFHVTDEQLTTQLVLLAMAGLCGAAALAMLMSSRRASGRRAWGRAIAGLGMLLLPLAALPLVQQRVVYGPFADPPLRSTSHVDCDKAIYGSWNYEWADNDRLLAAADVCRAADRRSLVEAGSVLALAVGGGVAGAMMTRSRRLPPTASDVTRGLAAHEIERA